VGEGVEVGVRVGVEVVVLVGVVVGVLVGAGVRVGIGEGVREGWGVAEGAGVSVGGMGVPGLEDWQAVVNTIQKRAAVRRKICILIGDSAYIHYRLKCEKGAGRLSLRTGGMEKENPLICAHLHEWRGDKPKLRVDFPQVFIYTIYVI
jgi:hypothetical protein